MFSARLIYGLGVGVSLLSIFLWGTIVRAQIGGYKKNISIFKSVLLVFSVTSILSNVVPIWFDIYRIVHDANPTNIFYAYVISSYMYRTITALMFFIIYRY